MEQDNPDETSITYEEVLTRAQVERLIDPSITQTANALLSASYYEEEKTILNDVRERLTKEDPRELYLKCIKYLVDKIRNTQDPSKYFYVEQLDSLAIRGLGIKIDDLEYIGSSSKSIFKAEPKWDNIKKHIESVVLGKSFIEKISVPDDKDLWGVEFPLRISSCDASQHRYKLRIPFFRRHFSTPIVINNAAGIIKEKKTDNPQWINIVVPKNTQDFENWVVVGYDDYTNLPDNDYEWATKSAMDVGQFFVEEVYILPYGGAAKKPDIHLRDGRIFPQDHALNCKITNRHGLLTREAIWRMTTTLNKAKELGVRFCGLSKNVELKIFSTVIDWYIREEMKQSNWNPTLHIPSDTEVMRHILCNENFEGTFKEIYVTCKIIRSFYTTSNLNSRTDKQVLNDLDSLKSIMHNRGLSAKQIVESALKFKVAMFFAGHTNNAEYHIPRYEFAIYDEDYQNIDEIVIRILSAVRLASLQIDQDHLRDMEDPILLPVPLALAHDLSKKMGEVISRDWISRTYAEFIKMRNSHH